MNSKIAGLDQRVKRLEDGNDAAKSDIAGNKAAIDDLSKKVDSLDSNELSEGPKTYDEFVKQLINDGYVNVYFDFNSSEIQKASASSLTFMKAYLLKNSSATVEIQGYADELGSDEYNRELSQKRADAVVRLLSEAGISTSRLKAVGKGKDTSSNNNSDLVRQLARRATFIVK